MVDTCSVHEKYVKTREINSSAGRLEITRTKNYTLIPLEVSIF
jgi:hypothetical protein